MNLSLFLSKLEEFEWDKGNLDHIKKHNFEYKECEQIFYSKPLLISKDKSHSQIEIRYKVLGRTKKGRQSLIIFTLRERGVRVISARDQNKNERKVYLTLGGESK